MENIRIGVIGKIVAGDDAGMYVKVVDDSDSTGGFLIITAVNQDMKSGFDSWVQDYESLVRYFQEANWKVNWI